jgi:phosphoribosyl 1,2-cyclic phosphodiesterase
MRFASLGSGSAGNALLVEAGTTRLLIDCGFSATEAASRLQRIGVEPGSLTAILVTHEHEDHAGGVARLSRRHGVPVWMTAGTLRALDGAFSKLAGLSLFDSHVPFAIGDIEITPYPVPHDAREPAQFVFADGARRLGLLTDAGSLTAHMVRTLSGVDAFVLECNHDRELLANGRYPASLKARVGGRFGHLANDTAAELLAAIDRTRLQHIIAAHLSRQNNRPELATIALSAVLGCTPDEVTVADQDLGFDWRQLS